VADALRFEVASDLATLPPAWDALASCVFQRRGFLRHLEVHNPCRQRYHLLWRDDELRAGACVYTLRLDLLTFSRVASPIRMQVVGVPASVSAPGVVGRSPDDVETLIRQILRTERGLVLGLNIEPAIDPSPAIAMAMLPTVVLRCGFKSWSDYLAALRAPYRRRARRILEAFRGVRAETTACSAFTDEHQRLYLQIMRRTPSKLEQLTPGFFRELPSEFSLTSYSSNGRLLCWHVVCRDNDTLYFLFGGHDYDGLATHQSYFNNLFGILGEAIDLGVARVDFGQTAEVAKMKTGAEPRQLRLFLHHRSRVVRGMLRLGRPWLEYHAATPVIHALRGSLSAQPSSQLPASAEGSAEWQA
jgi:hypothetical protein